MFLKEPIQIKSWNKFTYPGINLYPGGEVRLGHVPSELGEVANVTVRLEDSDSIMALCQIDDILSDAGIITTLRLPYIPYGRQDRREPVPGNQALGIKVFARILNSLKSFSYIETYDPHSIVTSAVIDNLTVIDRVALLARNNFILSLTTNGFKKEDMVVLSPDAGALKISAKIAAHYEMPLITAFKSRDPISGRLTDPVIYEGEKVKGKHVLIIDDICDGGGTFVPLENLIRQYGAASAHLCVTHGIFSKGLKPLMNFDSITGLHCFISTYNKWTEPLHQEEMKGKFNMTETGFVYFPKIPHQA